MNDALVSLLVILAVIDLAWRLVDRRPKKVVSIETETIAAEVYRACAHEGLPADALTDATDLIPTGKLYAVLHHSANALGKDHELRTVQDVIDWLAVAPPKG